MLLPKHKSSHLIVASLILVGGVMLSGCATNSSLVSTGTDNEIVTTSEKLKATKTKDAKSRSKSKASSVITSTQETAAENVETSEESLPKLELDAKLLEELLITQLASYAGDWQRAGKSALLVAKLTQDYRVARLAALLAMRAKNYKEAVEGAELWQELNKNSRDASTALLLAQLGQGDVDAAYRGFEVGQGDQLIDEYIKEVSGVLIRQTNAEVAVAISERYIDAYPDSAQVALSGAYVAEKFKQEELTEEWLAKVLLLKPNWDLAAQLKANLLRSQGRYAERSNYIEEFVVSNPDSIGMRINYAAELAREENFEKALDIMRAVVKDDRSNVAALVYAAALAQHIDKTRLAIKYYKKALAVDPRNDEVRWSLARIFVQEEDYQKAESYYQAIADAQYYFSAQLQVANMRYHTNGLNSAIKILRGLEPRTENEYIDRATTRHYLLMQENQFEEAFSAINETLAYLPDNLELVYARALVAAELREFKTAEKDFRYILKKQPNHADAMNALGYTLADQTTRFEEAKELIVRALELQPSSAHILDSMGWVLFRLNELDEAVEYLQKAYELSNEVEVAAHLGEVLWVRGEFEKARGIWRAAFDQESENPLLASTLERFGVQFTGSQMSQVTVNDAKAK